MFWDMLKNWHREERMEESQNLTQLKADVDAARATLEEILKLSVTLEELREEGRKLQEMTAQAWQGDSGDEMAALIREWMNEQKSIADSVEGYYKTGTQRLNQLVEADAALAHYIRNS